MFVLHTMCGIMVVAINGGNGFEFRSPGGAKGSKSHENYMMVNGWQDGELVRYIRDTTYYESNYCVIGLFR